MTGDWTGHGGRLADARRTFGDGAEPWLDLSTGINPQPWPGTADIAIDWQRLPEENDLRALEDAAAGYFGVDPGHVVALPGSETGMRLLAVILPGPARYVVPTYRTHGEIFTASAPVALSDLAGTREGVVILANPNNPDGRIVAKDALRRPRDGWLVIDEAFADPDPGLSIAAEVRDDGRLIVFRSFGKFFGLAGVRLGFAIAPRPVVARFRALLGAWPVSAAAIAIGTAAYRDARWIAATRARLPEQARALDAALSNSGLVPRGECPLFRLVEVEDAAATFARLATRAILTRPFDYNPHWLRLGLPGDASALARLEAALAGG